jgi:hydroxymethylpyrimidine pyrophosphatase-like HAD family hydrolase
MLCNKVAVQMYFLALAADYDGTVARDGVVAAETLDALTHFRETGRRLLLVTGRDLPDLKRACPELAIFDRIVAENGALLYDPATQKERTLAPPPKAKCGIRISKKKWR